MTDKKLQTKIASLAKKIDAKQGSLEMARERRKMSGKSKGVQSEREVNEGSEIKIPTEDGIGWQDIRLIAGEGKLTQKTIKQAIDIIRKQRKEQGIAEGSEGMFSKIMGHETSPEAAKLIQQQGFKKSHTGIFFNVSGQNYSGGGYGGTMIMARVSGPMDDILNLEDDNDLPDDLDDFADGEEIANYARSEGYWAWTDGVQFAVLDPRHIQIIKQGVAEGLDKQTFAAPINESYVGRETKEGTWRVFQTGKAVAVAGPFKTREEANAWIKKNEEKDVKESSDYFRRREREEGIISGKRPARKRAPAQTSDYAKRREQEKKQGLSEGKVKELSMDLKDKTMSEEEFKKKYGKTRAEMRKSFKSDTGKKKKVSESVVQTRRLEELNEKAEKLADLYEKVKQRRDFETMSKIKSAMGRVAKKRNEIKESLGITESEDTPNPAYDYKFWDEMTPSEKIRSHTLGKGITVWNPQSRKYAVKFPVPKGQVAPAPNSLSEDSNITADQLDIGDEVIITGNVQFQGSTGVIDDFGRDKAFVVVNLYNHGKHSFHSSDVSFNDYAGSEEEDADWRERDGVYESMLEEALDTYKKLAGIKTSK